jgi:hypothetical protein
MNLCIEPSNQQGDFALLGLSEHDAVNIAFGLFTITIKRNDVGISIDVYPQAATDADPLASLQAWDDDASIAAD